MVQPHSILEKIIFGTDTVFLTEHRFSLAHITDRCIIFTNNIHHYLSNQFRVKEVITLKQIELYFASIYILMSYHSHSDGLTSHTLTHAPLWHRKAFPFTVQLLAVGAVLHMQVPVAEDSRYWVDDTVETSVVPQCLVRDVEPCPADYCHVASVGYLHITEGGQLNTNYIRTKNRVLFLIQ